MEVLHLLLQSVILYVEMGEYMGTRNAMMDTLELQIHSQEMAVINGVKLRLIMIVGMSREQDQHV